jgi:methyl-accepting chemotaxis protein
MKQRKLGTTLLAGGLITLAIPMIIIGIIAVYQSSRTISEIARSNMVGISNSLAQAVGIAMSERLCMVRNISFSNSVIAVTEKMAKEGGKNSLQEIALVERELIKIKESEGDHLSSVNLVGKDGVFFASSNSKMFKGQNVSAREYFKTALKGIPNVGSAVISAATGKAVCTAAAPIYGSDGKTITGVALVSMELKYITDIIDQTKIGKSGYVYVIDKTGLYVTHPVKGNILKVNITQVKGMEAVAGLVGQDKSGIVEYTLDGIPKLAAVAFEPVTGWGVVASQPISELYAPVGSTRNVIVIIGVIFLVLASILFYFFSKRLTLPLVNIAGAAQKIAAGDLTVEITSGSRQDEIGSLSRAFELMTGSLKERARAAEQIAAGDLTVKVTPLSDADVLGNAFSVMVEKLRSQTKGIMEGFNVLSSAVSEILAATTQVASGTAESAAAISETTTSVEEVRHAAQLTSEKAQNVAASAKRVAQASQTGQRAVEETVAGMRHIRGQMDSITLTIVRLSEQGQSIGGIIASVTDLADQSNLLAVNAGIEAARAGEQGKGFAVVAQEIKSLAEQSKQATAQVRSILSDVQKATGAAVMATEQGSKAVDAGMKQSEQAGEAIRILTKSSEEASQTATQIVASSQQQAIGMDQIRVAMENINQAGTETVASMRQSEAAAKNLDELGQTLRRLVEQYKV